MFAIYKQYCHLSVSITTNVHIAGYWENGEKWPYFTIFLVFRIILFSLHLFPLVSVHFVFVSSENLTIDLPRYLKVPKCENFHRTDFFYFYTIKPLWVGDFRVKIKN